MSAEVRISAGFGAIYMTSGTTRAPSSAGDLVRMIVVEGGSMLIPAYRPGLTILTVDCWFRRWRESKPEIYSKARVSSSHGFGAADLVQEE